MPPDEIAPTASSPCRRPAVISITSRSNRAVLGKIDGYSAFTEKKSMYACCATSSTSSPAGYDTPDASRSFHCLSPFALSRIVSRSSSAGTPFLSSFISITPYRIRQR